MKIINKLTLCAVAVSLTGCNYFRSYDYDDNSVYQYDVGNHPGVGFYEDMDYQDDFYKDRTSVMHHNMEMERNYGGFYK